jgi:GNAT superfamily N-acetyltransferase
MKDEHLNQLMSIDELTFQRDEPRSLENLSALKRSDPGGCLVMQDGEEIIGYTYSKTMGNEGYLGPLGIIPKYRNMGLGKVLIQKNLDYLRKKCKIIGLEALPENGDVIGFYQKMGFVSGFPSYIFHIPKKLKMDPPIRDVSLKNASDMGELEFSNVLNGIKKWDLNQINFTQNLSLTQELGGNILMAFNGEYPVGFLAYSQTLNPIVLGAVNNTNLNLNLQQDIFKILINNFSPIKNCNNAVLQVNSQYDVLVDLMIEMGFKLYRSINRMYLKGYEGNNLEKRNELIMMPWRG